MATCHNLYCDKLQMNLMQVDDFEGNISEDLFDEEQYDDHVA